MRRKLLKIKGPFKQVGTFHLLLFSCWFFLSIKTPCTFELHLHISLKVSLSQRPTRQGYTHTHLQTHTHTRT